MCQLIIVNKIYYGYLHIESGVVAHSEISARIFN